MVSNRHENIHFHAYIEELSMFSLKIQILVLVINYVPYLNTSKNPRDTLKKILHNPHNLFEIFH